MVEWRREWVMNGMERGVMVGRRKVRGSGGGVVIALVAWRLRRRRGISGEVRELRR